MKPHMHLVEKKITFSLNHVIITLTYQSYEQHPDFQSHVVSWPAHTKNLDLYLEEMVGTGTW